MHGTETSTLSRTRGRPARFSTEEVTEIRTLYQSGIGPITLGKRYNVSYETIKRCLEDGYTPNDAPSKPRPPESKKEGVKWTFKTKVQIYDSIKAALKPANDGRWEYKTGVSDESIAKEHGVGTTTVMLIRKDCFGLLVQNRFFANQAELLAKIKKLSKELAELKKSA